MRDFQLTMYVSSLWIAGAAALAAVWYPGHDFIACRASFGSCCALGALSVEDRREELP